MEDYMALDSATCAENYYAAAAEEDKASSGTLGLMNSAAMFGNFLPVLIIIPWLLFGLITFGIGWFVGYPAVLVLSGIAVPLGTVAIAFPDVESVIRWRLTQMLGFYQCAIGEDGFTSEGHQDLKRAAQWIFMAMESHEMFFDLSLIGWLLNNDGLMKDVNALVKEYA